MEPLREGIGLHISQTVRKRLWLAAHAQWRTGPGADVGEQACMNCHRGTVQRLIERTAALQQNTRSLLDNTEVALSALMDAIVEARDSGVPDESLREARQAHRRAQLRWDFIDADASRGFHAGQEAVRLLSDAIDMARTGEDSARQAIQAGTDTP